jgi:hypothetical protein
VIHIVVVLRDLWLHDKRLRTENEEKEWEGREGMAQRREKERRDTEALIFHSFSPSSVLSSLSLPSLFSFSRSTVSPSAVLSFLPLKTVMCSLHEVAVADCETFHLRREIRDQIEKRRVVDWGEEWEREAENEKKDEGVTDEKQH